MISECLDFEKPLEELAQQVQALRLRVDQARVDASPELAQLTQKLEAERRAVFSNLSLWQTVQLARHPLRPHAQDIIERVFSDFDLLSGDRMSADCEAIIGGIATLDGQSVMVVAQQKGRTTKDKLRHNFGMPKPQGYRKAKRLFKLAERFSMPIITLLDSPGAYAGVDAEMHNQSEALATNIELLCSVRTPVISVVLGEAMSGGAMACGVCDHIAMLEHAIYSVISPEGCASILWKDAGLAKQAAEALQVSARKLAERQLIDALITEPLGGAHRDFDATAQAIKSHLLSVLPIFQAQDQETLLINRYHKWMLEQL